MPLIKLPKLRKGPKLPSTVVDFIEAYNTNNISGMLADVTDDVMFRHYCDAGVLFKAGDKVGFEAALNEDASAFKQRTHAVKTSMTMLGSTVLTTQFEAVVAQDLSNGWKAGTEIKLPSAAEFQFRDERIANITFRT
ncbi:MAG: hypothetical protein AB8B88_05545 [Devosiaceae bacterium]